MTKLKILITGADGFIGSNVKSHLESSNKYDVCKLTQDLTDAESVILEVESLKPDIIIHTAAIVGTIACDVAGGYAIDVNVRGSYNIAKAAKKVNAKLIYIGTTASYKIGVMPIVEETPSEPETLYGLTKYAGELVCKQILEKDKLLVLRFCFAFGINDGHSGIWNMINSYKRNRPCILQMSPESLKDFMFVSDFCEAVRLAIKNDLNGLYNVSYNKPRALKDVINVLNNLGITPILYYKKEDDYMQSHIVNSSKFRKATGWTPQVTLERGIKKCVK